jgi:hypothetical protein
LLGAEHAGSAGRKEPRDARLIEWGQDFMDAPRAVMGRGSGGRRILREQVGPGWDCWAECDVDHRWVTAIQKNQTITERWRSNIGTREAAVIWITFFDQSGADENLL